MKINLQDIITEEQINELNPKGEYAPHTSRLQGRQKTPLRWCDLYGYEMGWFLAQQPELTKALIEVGVDVRVWNNEGLRYAACLGHIDVVKLLLEAGADVHAGEDEPLYWAKHWQDTEMVKVLEDWIKEHG